MKLIDLDVMRNSDIVEPHCYGHQMEKTFWIIEGIVNNGRTMPDLAKELSITPGRVRQRRDHGLRMIASFIDDAEDPTGLFHQSLVVLWRIWDDDAHWFEAVGGNKHVAGDCAATFDAALVVLGMKRPVWDLLAWRVASYSNKLFRLWEKSSSRTSLIPVQDRFSAVVQSWTPEAQWHEFEMMRGDVEVV